MIERGWMSMSWTDRRRTRRLRSFWRRRLAPAAEELRKRGVAILDDEDRRGDDSWFRPVDPAEAELLEVESADVAAGLARLWRRQGFAELERLAPAIAQLSGHLYRDEPDDDGEISSDVYAMY